MDNFVLLQEWHPAKNLYAKLSDFSTGSNFKAWWICEKSHEWQASIKSRFRGTGCPYCSNRKVWVGFNDMASQDPLLALEFNLVKNLNLTPQDIVVSSTKKFWWLCDKGHEWEATGYARHVLGRKCPYCSGVKILTGFNDLKTLYPKLYKELHRTKNLHIQIENISPSSTESVWWMCDKGHNWFSPMVYRTARGLNCLVCSGRQLLRGVNDLLTINPDLSLEWNFNKNVIGPHEIKTNDRKPVWWICKEGHEWATSVRSRIKGDGCPVCGGKVALAGFNDLKTKNPDLAKEWHPTKNKSMRPEMVTAGSGKRVWWLGKCGHEWQTQVNDRNFYRTGCPYCSGQTLLVGFNDLVTRNPELAKEWHPTKNGNIAPSDVTFRARGEKVWWVCDKGHEWPAAVYARAAGNGCGKCSSNKSKAETEIYNYIANLGATVSQSNRRIIKGYEVDIYLPDYQVAIEYNGLYWHSDAQKSDKEYHLKKWRGCREAGISLIFIWEDEWIEQSEKIKEQLNFILEGKQPHLVLDEPVSNGSFSEYWLRRNGNNIKEILPPSVFYVKGQTRYSTNTTGKYYTVWDAGSTIFENSIQE